MQSQLQFSDEERAQLVEAFVSTAMHWMTRRGSSGLPIAIEQIEVLRTQMKG